MGRSIKVIVALFAVVSFITVAPVFAQQEEAQEAQLLQTTAESAETTDAENPAATREDRVKQYKERRKNAITAVRANRLKSVCKNAQGKLTSLSARVNGVATARENAHKQISERVDAIIAKLQAANIDTAALEAVRASIQEQGATVSEQLAAYQLALSDLSEMDCEADPEAFGAALEEARELSMQLRQSAFDFRQAAKEELRTLLQQARSQLPDADSSGATINNTNQSGE